MVAPAFRSYTVLSVVALTALASLGCAKLGADASGRDQQAATTLDRDGNSIGTEASAPASASTTASGTTTAPAATESGPGAPTEAATNPTPITPTMSAPQPGVATGTTAPAASDVAMTGPSLAANFVTPVPASEPVSMLPPITLESGSVADTAPNCVLHAGYLDTPDFCQSYGFCDQGVIGSYCGKSNDGTWDCSCNGYTTVGSFKATAGDASLCAQDIPLCANIASPRRDRTGYTCDADTAVADAESCTLNRSCSKQVTVSDQHTGTLKEERLAHCVKQEDGTLLCDCGAFGAGRQYELAAADSMAAGCETVMALCEGDLVAQFQASEDCETTSTQTADGCATETYCTARAAVAAGVTGVLTTGTPVNCQELPDGSGWDCNCGVYRSDYGPSRNLYFTPDADVDTTTSSVCDSHQDLCRHASPSSLQTELTCQINPNGVTIEADYCDAVINCTQDAEVDGHHVVLKSYPLTACKRVSGDAWSCACSSASGGEAGLQITASDSAQACEASAALCPGLRPNASLDL